MVLGLWGKLTVVGLTTGIVILVLIVVICFVGPGCWGYEYLFGAIKRKRDRAYLDLPHGKGIVQLKQMGGGAWLSDNGSSYDMVGSTMFKVEKQQPRPKSIIGVGEVNETVNNPRLFFNLLFNVLNEETLSARLTIDILEIKCLPAREYTSMIDSYIILEVCQITPANGERLLEKHVTRVVKHSHNPVFNQRFIIDGQKLDLQNWRMKIFVIDKDKLVKECVTCECKFDLKKHEELLLTNDTIPMKIDLVEIENIFGEVLFGISYFPTAQRLKISIIKLINLKIFEMVASLSEFYPYIKVLLVSSTGKLIKKRKTSTKHCEVAPIFDETLIFDLAPKDLENVNIIILLCNKTIEYVNGDASSVDSESSKSSNSKDNVIGRVFLGRNVKNRKGRDHWITVMQNPRKIVSVWHVLT